MWFYWLVNKLFIDQPRFIVQSFPLTKEEIDQFNKDGWYIRFVPRPDISTYQWEHNELG